ncbi:MAG: hypothetical protein WA919_24725 [Coleofasciculaceae cyanobacterium]
MDDKKLQEKHFAILKTKYHVNPIKSVSSPRLLYMILRKADLEIQIADLEFKWLAKNYLYETIGAIRLQQYGADDLKRLEAECLQLKLKYRIPENSELPISSPVYSILCKLDTEQTLTDSEIELLNTQGFQVTASLARSIQDFAELKKKYKATQYPDEFPESPLYPILKKIDKRELLSDSEADWLLEAELETPLEVFWQQEEERKAEIEFPELKSKYKVSSHPDTSISSPLYSILKKLDRDEELNRDECKWLEKQKLSNLVELEQERKERRLFAQLKEKYNATQYQDTEPSSRLYIILRNLELSQLKFSSLSREMQAMLNNPEMQISEKDIDWLRKVGLSEAEKITQQLHFKLLKSKYKIMGSRLPMEPFYEIMLKIEREERLDPKQVVQLIEEGQLSRSGKIAIAHYRLEAIFYEKEYKRTGNRWNLPSASSNWRKAGKPGNALKATDSVNLTKVRESDLKSALLVTRGAAFRDLGRLDEAEECANQARESQPDSHQPYTLMGAICYDRGEYSQGDKWFEMALKRGANDMDDEIERIVRMTKDKGKRKEVAEYLLDKDPKRYAWAKSYIAR